MRTVSDQLCPSGVVVSLPDAPLDDHVGAIEVLIQEGLTTFALPAACEAFAGVVAIFGARAVVGATRVADADGVRLAAERGVEITFLRYLKVGFPLMLLTVFLSMIYIYLRYLM